MSEAGRAVAAARAAAAAGEGALVLAPSSTRGWFGGHGLVAWGAAGRRIAGGDATGDALQAAGEALEGAYAGQTGPVAVLLTYEGDAHIAEFEHAVPLSGASVQAALGTPCVVAEESLLDRPHSDLAACDFRGSVLDVRQRIAAGDVYVLNLTRRVFGAPTVGPFDALAALVARGGAEMSALLDLPSVAVASISPERFLGVRGSQRERTAAVSPIKGTRPRGTTQAADRALASELAADPKELAEHLMVVDLERNDLGRVCQPGSVTVDPLYEVITTPYCHQLVSTVRGALRPDATLAELLEATFPCGSVTGAPKRAAVRIAAELEASHRDAYCGALLVALPGRLDSSVLIRTLEFRGDGSAAWGTGCGITFESDPAAEWLESELKAAPVIGDGAPDVALRETCRIAGGRVPLLDRHLARLTAGGCGPTLLARVRESVATELASAHAPATRLAVTAHPDGSVRAETTVAPSSLAVPGGVTVAFFEVPEPPSLPPGAAKPADRSVWDAAQTRAKDAGADLALLVAADGTVIDGATASVWVRFGDRLLTPPSPPALAGVARGLVFDAAIQLGFTAEESQLTPADIESAEEVFLTNAYAGVVAGRGGGGSATTALAAIFESACEPE